MAPAPKMQMRIHPSAVAVQEPSPVGGDERTFQDQHAIIEPEHGSMMLSTDDQA